MHPDTADRPDSGPPAASRARRPLACVVMRAVQAALLGLVVPVGSPLAEIPPPGTDVMRAAGSIEITVDGIGTDYVRLIGDVAIARYPPGPGLPDSIPIEIVSLRLTGSSPVLGMVGVEPCIDMPSTGFTRRMMGAESPSDSFFDVWFDVSLPDLGLHLTQSAYFRIQTPTTAVPFLEVFTEIASQSVPLVDEVSGMPMGALTHAALDPNPRVDILFTDALLEWTIGPGGGPETIPLAGRSIVVASESFSPPPEPEHPEFNTEIIAMDLSGVSPLWGDTAFREQIMLHSPGRSRAINPGPIQYPADSFFDVFFDLRTSSFDMFCVDPLTGRATIDGWPPFGTPYASSRPCDLFSAGGVQPTGTLNRFSWTWTRPAGACMDADGDGVEAPPCGSDCDDNDPDNYPGNLETCTDQRDNNCNQAIDCQDPLCLGRACNDGDACTQNDRCILAPAGGVVCQGGPVDCDDNDLCTLDRCNPDTGACEHVPVVCDDGNACTIDRCNPATGQCEFVPVVCDDGLFCNGFETCDPANGMCRPGPPPDCNDQNPCTRDTCNESIHACAHVLASTLLGTDGTLGNLHRIDPATGAAFLIGPIGFSTPSIEVDPVTGVLYAGRGGGSPLLYRLDPNTGAPTLVGNTGLGLAAIAGLAFDPGGRLYAAVNIVDAGGTGADTLALIDTTTGAASVIGPFGGGIGTQDGPGGIEGIAFDGAGRLHGTSAVQSGSTGSPTLYLIDVATGAATAVASLRDAAGNPPAGGVVGLEFDVDGTLYGGTGAGTGNLVRIKPSTGEFVLIGPSVPRSLATLAFLNCGCSSDLECDDGNPCTRDVCDPETGECRHDPLPDTTPCDDGQMCTNGDRCLQGHCAGAPVVCDDGDACTADACEPAVGCVHRPIPLVEPDPLLFGSQTTMSWPATLDASHWNTYRGTIPGAMLGSRLPGPVYDQVCFESGDALGDGPLFSTDADIPPAGTAYYYLSSGEGSCGESDIGHPYPAGGAIPNTMACPTPP